MPEQTVTLRCESCDEQRAIPLADIPDDAPLSMIARTFLAGHRTCSISIQLTQR